MICHMTVYAQHSWKFKPWRHICICSFSDYIYTTEQMGVIIIHTLTKMYQHNAILNGEHLIETHECQRQLWLCGMSIPLLCQMSYLHQLCDQLIELIFDGYLKQCQQNKHWKKTCYKLQTIKHREGIISLSQV